MTKTATAATTATDTSRSARRRGPATPTTAPDATAPDTTAPDTTAAAAEPEGTVSEATDESSSWEDVLPLVAMRIGSRPSGVELRAARTVWRVLQDSQGQTAMQIAANAEIGGMAGIEGKTVSKILARFARAGMASGADGADGVRRWQVGSPATLMADERAASQSGESNGRAGGGDVLPSGALRGLVEDFLIDNPDREWTATDVANKIGRSSGAVNNALFTLCEKGSAVLTGESPRRFRYQGENSDTSEVNRTGENGSTGENGE